MVGLDQVNNTSDANKPISTAVQTALNSCISSLAEGVITTVTQNGANTSGLSYTFVTSPYFSDSISVSCPIASTESGSFTTANLSITNTITTITCTVNKNSSFFSNPTVNTISTLPITKTTKITGNQGAGGNYAYNFKQYFLNANTFFQPTYENASNTYTITFSISGTGRFEYNTTTAQIINL